MAGEPPLHCRVEINGWFVQHDDTTSFPSDQGGQHQRLLDACARELGDPSTAARSDENVDRKGRINRGATTQVQVELGDVLEDGPSLLEMLLLGLAPVLQTVQLAGHSAPIAQINRVVQNRYREVPL